jgi:hypothetical protein
MWFVAANSVMTHFRIWSYVFGAYRVQARRRVVICAPRAGVGGRKRARAAPDPEVAETRVELLRLGLPPALL